MNLQEIDSAKITILVDNITDRLLPSSSLVKRPPMVNNQKIARAPIAELWIFNHFGNILYS